MENLGEDALTVLACELDMRPGGAPTLDNLLPAVRGVRREPGSIALAFDAAMTNTVRAFAEAETLCCPEIGWQVETEPGLILRISADPEQLAILSGAFGTRDA